MAEELQNLLKRIQKDGVEKAEAETEKIVSAAREKAETIKKEAEENANAILKKTEQDAKAFTARGRKSLEQAARDVVLSVGDAVQATLKRLVNREVSQAMTANTLKQMLVKTVESYCKKESEDSRIDILLSPEQQKEIVDFFMSKFSKELKKGLEIKSDAELVSGFRVSVVNDEVEHDFSGEAITEALCRLLRPHLAEIIRSAQSTTDKS